MKSISVALATHNGARFLPEQLESLARQTTLPDELVVHDDGSTDGTVEVLSAFSTSAPFPVRVERGAGGRGFAGAFFEAARACAGDLVALCDQDDVFLPDKLERCRAAFDDPDVLVAVHSSRVVDERLVPTGRLYPSIGRTHVAPRLSADLWLAVRGMSMVVDARVVRAADPQRRPPSHYLEAEAMHHDEWLYAVACSLGSVAFLAEPLALYRQHGANVTRLPGRLAPLREALTTGWAYYTRRRDQARALAELTADLATASEDDAVARAAGDSAASLVALAERLDRRAAVYEPRAGARGRARRLVRLARDGGYAPGRGFGRVALARDAVMIALGRHGER